MDDVLWLRHFQEKQGMEGNAVDGTHPCASKTPAGASGSCIVGDVFFGWDIKTTNPQALVIQEPVVLSTRAGVFNPPSWQEASGNSSMKRRLSLRHHVLLLVTSYRIAQLVKAGFSLRTGRSSLYI